MERTRSEVMGMLHRLHCLESFANARLTLPSSIGTATLVAAGPITEQPSSMTARLVLVFLPSPDWDPMRHQFVVWNQYYESKHTPNGLHSSMQHGNYFQVDQLAEAVACFARRLGETADTVKSMYCDEEKS